MQYFKVKLIACIFIWEELVQNNIFLLTRYKYRALQYYMFLFLFTRASGNPRNLIHANARDGR